MLLTMSVDLEAPPDRVWEFLVAPEKARAWFQAIEVYEWTSDRSGVGPTFHWLERSGSRAHNIDFRTEVLARRGGELLVFSAWGTKADWYRNIEAGGIDELWDGRARYPGAEFRQLEPDESYEVIAAYEREHHGTAKRTLPRMLEGYDFSDEMRWELAKAGTIIAFRPKVV